jgi:hypothetical protein
MYVTRAPQKLREVPRLDPASSLVVQTGLDLGFQHTKFLRLLQNIRYGRLLKLYRQQFQCRGRLLGEFAHDRNIARILGR